MESMHGCFPKLLVYMVQTGETSGTLDHILEKMSSYYEKEVEMAGKVRTAMIYPCILFFASIGASAFLLTSVLPQFRVMLAEYELPAITRFMMKAGAYLQDNWLLYVCFLSIVPVPSISIGLSSFSPFCTSFPSILNFFTKSKLDRKSVV